jgi:hypothetical protein
MTHMTSVDSGEFLASAAMALLMVAGICILTISLA